MMEPTIKFSELLRSSIAMLTSIADREPTQLTLIIQC